MGRCPTSVLSSGARRLPAYLAYPPPKIQAVLAEPLHPPTLGRLIGTPEPHPRNDENFYQTNLRLDYTFSDAVALTSLSSYQHFKESNRVDQAGVAAPEESTQIHGNVKAYFRRTSTARRLR